MKNSPRILVGKHERAKAGDLSIVFGLHAERFFSGIRKIAKEIISFVLSVRLSVRLHETSRLPMGGFE
jgi:hypothetical protein